MNSLDKEVRDTIVINEKGNFIQWRKNFLMYKWIK